MYFLPDLHGQSSLRPILRAGRESIRGFFKWLCRQNHLLSNPASDLQLPRLEKRLPKHVLTHPARMHSQAAKELCEEIADAIAEDAGPAAEQA